MSEINAILLICVTKSETLGEPFLFIQPTTENIRLDRHLPCTAESDLFVNLDGPHNQSDRKPNEEASSSRSFLTTF